MSEIIKIALLGIAGVLFAIQFRQQRPEYTLLIGFALSVLVFSYVLGLTGQLLEEFAGLQQYLGDAKGYLGILMKVVGITYLCEFSAGICRMPDSQRYRIRSRFWENFRYCLRDCRFCLR